MDFQAEGVGPELISMRCPRCSAPLGDRRDMASPACHGSGSCDDRVRTGRTVLPEMFGGFHFRSAMQKRASELAMRGLQAEISDLRRRWHAAISNHRSLELGKEAAKARWYQERAAEWVVQSRGLRRAMKASVAFGSLGLLTMCVGGFNEPSLGMTLISALAFLSFLVVLDKGPSKVPTQLQLAQWSSAGPLDDTEFRTRFDRLALEVERHRNILQEHQDFERSLLSRRVEAPDPFESCPTGEPLPVSSCA